MVDHERRQGVGVRNYVWVSAAAATSLSLLATTKGPGLSPDSTVYLSTGINLAKSGHLRTLAGKSLTIFPPAMSVVAAGAELVGLGAQTGVRLFTASCAAALVVCSYLLMRQTLGRITLLFSTLLVAVSPVVLTMSKMAWSEVPFMLITVIFLLVANNVWRSGQLTLRNLVVLVLLCWLGFLFRYSGVFLIAAGGLILLVALRPFGLRSLARVALFAVLAVSVPFGWTLRNHAVDGSWLGPRTPSTDTPMLVIKRLLSTVGYWVAGSYQIPGGALVVIGVLSLSVLVVLLALGVPSGATLVRPGVPGSAGASVIVIVVYVVYLSAAQLTAAFDPIGTRLLSPVYVPLVLVGAGAANSRIERLSTRGNRTSRATWITVAACLFLTVQFAVSLRGVHAGMMDGIGYNSSSWRNSELAAITESYARRRPSAIFTNEPLGLWASTGLQPIAATPGVWARGNELDGQLAAFVKTVRCSELPVVVALFNDGDSHALSAGTLGDLVHVVNLASAGDGALYAVEPTADTALCASGKRRTGP